LLDRAGLREIEARRGPFGHRYAVVARRREQFGEPGKTA
jgi:hypothetical protein